MIRTIFAAALLAGGSAALAQDRYEWAADTIVGDVWNARPAPTRSNGGTRSVSRLGARSASRIGERLASRDDSPPAAVRPVAEAGPRARKAGEAHTLQGLSDGPSGSTLRSLASDVPPRSGARAPQR